MVLEKIFFQLANHKQELPMAATEILYRLSGSREDVLETDQPENKNGIWQPYLLQIGMK
jgi:hypothetical protein